MQCLFYSSINIILNHILTKEYLDWKCSTRDLKKRHGSIQCCIHSGSSYASSELMLAIIKENNFVICVENVIFFRRLVTEIGNCTLYTGEFPKNTANLSESIVADVTNSFKSLLLPIIYKEKETFML